MAEHVPFDNFTEDTCKKIYQLTYELFANQTANPYGIEVTVNTTSVLKENNASA